MKMKRMLRMLIAAILVSAIALPLMVMPASAQSGATVTFEPSDSKVSGYCETTEVDIYVTSDVNLGAGAIAFEYTYCCANVTEYIPNKVEWGFLNEAILEPGKVGIVVSSMFGAGSGKILVGTIKIHCCDEGSDCYTPLTWLREHPSPPLTYGFEDADENPVPTSYVDGSFTCHKVPMILESVAKIPDGDLTVIPDYPPGFEPRDQFEPCEWVYVWGHGFEFCQCYEIYIQPYVECQSVVEGQKLDHALSACLGYPDPGAGPIVVHVQEDGTFGPIPLFHATEAMICSHWEIVADKVPGPCDDYPIGCDTCGSATNPGVYMPDEDGLDAVACDVYGFHIVPEALSLILLSTGLIGLGGYYRLRRRKKTLSDE
jgi:hypothetical protein